MRSSSPRILSSSPNPPAMAPEQIPVVDLRFISQDELQTLFLSSTNSYDPLRFLPDVSAAVPKIDRSVFNESAGSRKQTYSRLRLAPHSNSKRPLPNPNPNDPSSSSDQIDPSSREHQQIISNLRLLFAGEDPSFVLPVPPPVAISPSPQTLSLDAPQNGKEKEEDNSKAPVGVQNNDRDKEIVNAKGMTINLGELAGKEDPYSEELRKRTAGLKSEIELLGFLGGLEGEWMSRRQRRRFVDASGFGDHLPKGWKLLLGLKRKEGVPWVNCRRYVSPNGHHFETCKEVTSYIQSLLGISPTAIAVSTKTNTIPLGDDKASPLSCAVSSHLAVNDDGPQECTKCNLSFGDKGEYLQHQLSFHQKSRKRRRNCKPVEDSVLMKDGKYLCQFCNKTFDERSRYFGHMGAHKRYQGLNPHEHNFGAALAIESPPLTEALKNENNPVVEANGVVGNPNNEQAVQIEVSPSVDKPKIEQTCAIQAPLSVENSKNEKAFEVQTPLSIEKPKLDNSNEIQALPSVTDPKNDRTVAIQSPSSIKNPEDEKASAIQPPSLIEDPKSNEVVSVQAPTLIKNLDNNKTLAAHGPPTENPKNDDKSEASEIQSLYPIGNPKNDKMPETTAIQASLSIENPKIDTEPDTMSFGKDESLEMSEGKSLEGNKSNSLTSCEVEEAFCGPSDNISDAGDAISGEVYQDGNATNDKPPVVFNFSLSQSCSADRDSEVKNNAENEHPTDNLALNHEVADSNANEIETASEVMNSVEVEPKLGIFDSTFANASTCSVEASQQACPDIETFDLNNYDIVDDGSKPEDIISATHRMLFETDTGTMSDETSFMDCDSVGEAKEAELAERPVTFSELLANANAHANASLAETSQTCQEAESLDLNNNTSDGTDTNEIEFEADKLATNNTAPRQTILTTTPTMDYNSDLFASCFSANMNEPNGVNGFDINTRDSLLEEWEKPDTGLESRFQNNHAEDIVSGGTGHNFMEMMTMQENLEGYTSLVQSASGIPMGNMMQDKLNSVGYQYLSQNNAALPGFSGMRLAPPEPSGYNAMPSANNPLHFAIPQQTMMFGYTPPQMVNSVGPSLQLGWGLPTPTKMMMPPAPCQFSSVCVWCSREFRHDGSLAEQQQSDTVGFICPSCKDRFAGHGGFGV